MNIREVLGIVRAYMKRNRIILIDSSLLAERGQVNLHWWRLNNKQNNIGDYLSLVVVEWAKNYYHITTNRSFDGKTKHLYAVGSIIGGGYQDAVVWGSGLIRSKPFYWWRKVRHLDIRAVRGPLTGTILKQNGYRCPEIYGDPAILMCAVVNDG